MLICDCLLNTCCGTNSAHPAGKQNVFTATIWPRRHKEKVSPHFPFCFLCSDPHSKTRYKWKLQLYDYKTSNVTIFTLIMDEFHPVVIIVGVCNTSRHSKHQLALLQFFLFLFLEKNVEKKNVHVCVTTQLHLNHPSAPTRPHLDTHTHTYIYMTTCKWHEDKINHKEQKLILCDGGEGDMIKTREGRSHEGWERYIYVYFNFNIGGSIWCKLSWCSNIHL